MGAGPVLPSASASEGQDQLCAAQSSLLSVVAGARDIAQTTEAAAGSQTQPVPSQTRALGAAQAPSETMAW